MALEIINEQIVETIDNFLTSKACSLYVEEKLAGKIPINRLELIYLVNSWGRDSSFYTKDYIQVYECKSKECYDLSRLDTSQITDMSRLFEDSLFNGDISNWNTSNVTNMKSMFYRAKSFNQNINSWDVSKVTDVEYMFGFAENFNSPLDKWNVSNVTDMSGMFYEAESFNQNINNWDISKVIYMYKMFYSAISFSKPILWNLSNINDIDLMFYEAKAFKNRFNNGKPLSSDNDDLKQWLKVNRDRMMAIDIKESEQDRLNNFYSNLNNIEKDLE